MHWYRWFAAVMPFWWCWRCDKFRYIPALETFYNGTVKFPLCQVCLVKVIVDIERGS